MVVNLPDYQKKVEQAVVESRRVQAMQHDQALLAQARALLSLRGWTINVRTRRNRQYVYASRRNGKRIEQQFICPVSELTTWIEQQTAVCGSHELIHCTTQKRRYPYG